MPRHFRSNREAVVVLVAALDEEVAPTYGKDDARLCCKLGGYVDVHFQACGVVAEARDASEGAIDGRDSGAEADEERGRQMHLV